LLGYAKAVAFEEIQHFQDKFMDADDTVSELNNRFEDAVGFRFHEDVRATVIFEQLVKEHGRAKVIRALVWFREASPNPAEAGPAPPTLITRSRGSSKSTCRT